MGLEVRKRIAYIESMIASFKSKALAVLFETGKSGKIDAKLHKRLLLRLDRLESAERPEDMNLPGFNFHALSGFNPTRYTVHINGPCCITFEFDGTNAAEVDLEQYH